jgi:Na+/proline symporter/nitrogen-specific signal transduction histidine kinase
MSADLLVAVCLAYVAGLFAVAAVAERQAGRGRLRILRGPWVYTLSLSVYCTAWTFYGAVGYAARSGLEFMVIYLGPTLMFLGWWTLLRKLVRIGRAERITSVADLVSSRYGKSTPVAALVTLLMLVATTPYIALQLQSISASFAAFFPEAHAGGGPSGPGTALWVAVGLATFTILFGTRRLDANERHDGIVSAIAVEAVVKLLALLAVGAFVTWGLLGGVGPALDTIDRSGMSDWTAAPGRWAGLIAVSAAAVLCLPRMFQVMVVENTDERHLAAASWAFPLYLLAMCAFVLPIAAAGLTLLPEGANPDLFVLTVPLAAGAERIAMLAFLGGFSAATSMVIVACVALATMLSNHVVMPVWLATRGRGGAQLSGDVRGAVLAARRLSILAVMALAWLYHRLTGGTDALAAIGLLAFVGVVQVVPALVLGLYWKGATRWGAGAGIATGFLVWLWTLVVPVFEGVVVPPRLLADGPWGVAWLRPEALFGLAGDPLISGLFFSLGLNVLALCLVSLLTAPSPLERLQAAAFVHVFERTGAPRGWTGGGAGAEELLIMAQRILGSRQAQALFADEARRQGRQGDLPDPTPALIDRLERELAGSVGAATAHAMVGGLTGGSPVSVEALMAVAGETAQIMEYSTRLEAQSRELRATAAQLREANAQLTALARQKDAFLSQISHELRTPMTSIRAFSEILRSPGLAAEERERYAGIILDESRRLTRLLDDLLDLAVLENGQVELCLETVSLHEVIDRAVTASTSLAGKRLRIVRDREAERITLATDPDRLSQVFINLVTNAAKYCDAPDPRLEIRVGRRGGDAVIDFVDNGDGIAPEDRRVIFEKFARLSDHAAAAGAGLGLAICREVMVRLGGTVSYLPDAGGGAFRVRLPVAAPGLAAAAE